MPVASPLLKSADDKTLIIMLIQKTLHMSQSLAECKARLASIQSYKRQFVMVTKATVTSSKTVDFSTASRPINTHLNRWAATLI